MAAENKVTKREWFEAIKELVLASDAEKKDEMAAFIDRELGFLDHKKEKAAERAAKKKAEGDELREAVYAVLTDEFQTIDAIVPQVDFEELSRAKVTARLTQLVKAGMAQKDAVKDADGRKVMGYKLGTGDNDNDDEPVE